MPFSAGRQDVRWGVASDGAGSLFAVWPTDNRDFSEFLSQHADIYAAKLPTLKRSTREPVLTDRPGREVVFYDLAPTEVEDLSRLRSYEIRSQPDFVTFVLASADFRGFRRESPMNPGRPGWPGAV